MTTSSNSQQREISALFFVACLLAAALATFGCRPRGTETASTMPDRSGIQQDNDSARNTTWDNADNSGGPCALEPVFFGFDKSELDARARQQLDSNASCILERQPRTVGITGMADPRGTTEYNLALGDRRALAAQRYVATRGVEPSIVQTRSVGEEMASGQDESSWAQDRRADFSLH